MSLSPLFAGHSLAYFGRLEPISDEIVPGCCRYGLQQMTQSRFEKNILTLSNSVKTCWTITNQDRLVDELPTMDDDTKGRIITLSLYQKNI